MSYITDVFGADVFNDDVMRERLPKAVYKKLRKTISTGSELDPSIADVVANAMKDWAVEKGATHYCHWFHPMTGVTAEKHDSFISPTGNGKVLIEFSGTKLIQGEPDASSFPSGGLRATFEARGYTAWDCTSPVFVKRDGSNTTLFIPCCFISYTGEVLDKKTPLLRSMEQLSKNAIRIMRCFGNTSSNRVISTLGPEQEYFLIDRKLYNSRLDLKLSGRTLFGAPSPKGQELDDHYFGSLKKHVADYMADLNTALWKLGVTATTQHNEVAPSQYELAPVFGTLNVAADHNQLVMEHMEKLAAKHGLACLLHEKPFAGVNGSGKHLNWSIGTDDGMNLLDPGETPHENAQFLVFMCAVVKAVDKYAALLRASVANPGNDHRLGANEAPPAIISIFLGAQLTDIMDQLAAGGAKTSKQGGQMVLGVDSLPKLARDSGDRNRTSPFAFIGNRFEFRMCGSSLSVSGPGFVLNTIVADVLSEIADELEGADNVEAKAQEILKDIATKHSRVVFNGDGYSEEWVEEAEKRGLPHLRNTVDALEAVLDTSTIEVFEKQGVLAEAELHARYETILEQYATRIGIEGKAALMIASSQILPAVGRYVASISSASGTAPFGDMIAEIGSLSGKLKTNIGALADALIAASEKDGARAQAEAYRDIVVPAMNAVREIADELEMLVDKSYWPLPSYADLLFAE